jgi:hypothetical protein
MNRLCLSTTSRRLLKIKRGNLKKVNWGISGRIFYLAVIGGKDKRQANKEK